jgi:hypothetical protein
LIFKIIYLFKYAQNFDKLNGPYSTNQKDHLSQKGHVEIDLSKIQWNGFLKLVQKRYFFTEFVSKEN